MAVELAFLYSNPNISTVIVGAGTPQELQQDIDLLNRFNNPELLQAAKELMSHYQSGPFTDSVDAYFAKKENKV